MEGRITALLANGPKEAAFVMTNENPNGPYKYAVIRTPYLQGFTVHIPDEDAEGAWQYGPMMEPLALELSAEIREPLFLPGRGLHHEAPIPVLAPIRWRVSEMDYCSS